MEREGEIMQEDEMSNFSLRNQIRGLAERVSHIERATIYKVGFWTSAGAWLIKIFGIFKLMGF